MGNRIVDLSLKLNQIAVPRTNEDTVMSGRFHVLKGGRGTNVKGLRTHLKLVRQNKRKCFLYSVYNIICNKDQ